MAKKSLRFADDVEAAAHAEAARLKISFTWVTNDCMRRILIHGQDGGDEESRESAKAVLRMADRRGMTDAAWIRDDAITLARIVLGIPASGRQTHRGAWWDADFLQEEAS